MPLLRGEKVAEGKVETSVAVSVNGRKNYTTMSFSYELEKEKGFVKLAVKMGNKQFFSLTYVVERNYVKYESKSGDKRQVIIYSLEKMDNLLYAQCFGNSASLLLAKFKQLHNLLDRGKDGKLVERLVKEIISEVYELPYKPLTCYAPTKS